MAVTWGNKILLHNASRQDFLNNKSWLRHEICHVYQFRKYGMVRFLLLYFIESLRKGYYNNRFELEARTAENDDFLTDNVHFL